MLAQEVLTEMKGSKTHITACIALSVIIFIMTVATVVVMKYDATGPIVIKGRPIVALALIGFTILVIVAMGRLITAICEVSQAGTRIAASVFHLTAGFALTAAILTGYAICI